MSLNVASLRTLRHRPHAGTDGGWAAVCSGCGWIYLETVSQRPQRAAEASYEELCPRCGVDEKQVFLLARDDLDNSIRLP
jgi:rubredoxin